MILSLLRKGRMAISQARQWTWLSKVLRPLPFRGVYINLERSKNRRAHIDAQLRKFGLQGHYQRFAAVDGRQLQHGTLHVTPDEVAALMSHVAALRHLMRYKKSEHILEDDTVLSKYVAPVMTKLIAQGIFDEYDMVYTDIIVVPDPDIVSFFAGVVGKTAFEIARSPADFSIVNLKTIIFTGSNSYFVGPNSIERVSENLQSEIRNGPTLPIDLHLNSQIREGAIRAACIIPFITSVHPEFSQNPEVAGRQVQPADKLLAIDLLRRLFFVDSRLDGIMSGLLEQLVGKKTPCLSRQHYLDAIIERLKTKPVMV
jgi:hypothetical protein